MIEHYHHTIPKSRFICDAKTNNPVIFVRIPLILHPVNTRHTQIMLF